MAIRFSDNPSATPVGTDIFPFSQDPSGANVDKKTTFAEAIGWDGIVKSGVILTTDATQTTLMSVSIDADTVYTFKFVVNAIGHNLATRGGFEVDVSVVRGGAAPSIINNLWEFSHRQTDVLLDVSFDISGNDLRLRVTGLAGTDVNWQATAFYNKLIAP